MFTTPIDLPLDVLPGDGWPSVQLGGRALHSRRDPRGEAERWADAILADMHPGDDDIVVVYGGGWGWHAQALAARWRGPLFVHEPVCALREGGEAAGRRPWGGGSAPYRPLDGPDDEVALGRLLTPGVDLHVVAHPVYARLAPEGRRQLDVRLQRLVAEATLYRRTARERAAGWADHNFANAAALASSFGVGRLQGVAAGLPAFLVAAGPSLDRNVAQLAEARTRGLVIVVNHALGALYRAGVRPHLVAALESRDVSNHFEVPPEYHERLLLGTMAHPSVFQLPARVRYAGHIGEEPVAAALLSAIEEPACMATGGSAATMAFSMAAMMAADPIVLVGQDLAFTGNRGYASGVKLADMRLERRDGAASRVVHAPDQYDHTGYDLQVFEVDGWDGRPVPTSHSLDTQRNWLERAIAGVQTGRRVVNATEGGADIAGAVNVPLADVLAGLPERDDPGTVLDPKGSLPVADRLRRMKRYATARRRRMDDALTLLDDGLRLADRALGCETGVERDRSVERFARVDAVLGERMRDLREVDAYLAATEPEDPKADKGDELESTRGLYERMHAATRTVRDRLLELERTLTDARSERRAR